ncbi:MAG: GTPase domain-containing protein [Chloroflexi bacterium]|nr:GTPase domain-containing protein [Chloroflexota bacterium]
MLTDALRDLARALERRAATAPGPNRAARAERLRRHVADYLLPRAIDAGAALVVVLLGSTGSGKSSLLNALTGRAVSPSGVLRPTTRRPVAVAHPDDAGPDLLPGVTSRDALELITDAGAGRGIVLVDAPDFDSVERENRALAVELLEAADLVIFVTTATRYADQVPWTFLGRARQRGVPLLAVLNRLPPDPEDAAAVLADYRHLLERRGLGDAGAFGRLEVVPVPEGAIDPDRDALDAGAVAPVRAALDRLLANEEERRGLARRSLAAAIDGLPETVEEVAREVDDEAAAATALAGIVDRSYTERRMALAGDLSRGTFLRAEVVRQWHDFIGAGQVARILSQGIGRIGAALRSLVRPGPPAPAVEVREAAFADLVSLVVQHVDAAARHSATAWMDDDYGGRAVGAHPELWGASPDLAGTLTASLEAWAEDIGERIRAMGEQRRGWAQVASLGVNAVGTSAVLAVFVHTGGLTGAEVGLTAATAVVNQKLLEAIFGEANVRAFVASARDRLDAILDDSFAADRARFEGALGSLGEVGSTAEALRDAAARAVEAGPS